MSDGFGAFGKIPGLGDFFRLNVAADFVQAWDQWLQQGMISAREQLGSSWDDAYLSAPIWRFTLPAGAAGNSAVSGILMASVDRVGRQYPLTLMGRHAGGQGPLSHFANRTVFEHLENIALAALDDGFTKDALSQALANVTWIEPQYKPVQGDAYIGAHPPAQIIAADQIATTHGDPALWSAAMEGHHRMMLTQGLPQGSNLVGLFDLDAMAWNLSEEASFL